MEEKRWREEALGWIHPTPVAKQMRGKGVGPGKERSGGGKNVRRQQPTSTVGRKWQVRVPKRANGPRRYIQDASTDSSAGQKSPKNPRS